MDTATYLSFVGALIVRRDLWRARARAPYVGSFFIHVGVLFQSALPLPAALVAEPLVTIRYGNASWAPRAFEIWMFKWPDLVWSFRQFSDEAKAAVCVRKPWRSLRKLLLYRAKGAYSLQDYRVWIKPRATQEPARWLAWIVAMLPGTLCHVIAVTGIRVLYPDSGVTLDDLRKSRFSIRRRFQSMLSHITGLSGIR